MLGDPAAGSQLPPQVEIGQRVKPAKHAYARAARLRMATNQRSSGIVNGFDASSAIPLCRLAVVYPFSVTGDFWQVHLSRNAQFLFVKIVTLVTGSECDIDHAQA
jgi:hypothetical protein